MHFEHYFWDFDGTLFDTYARVTRAFQKALGDAGLCPPQDEVYQKVKVSLNCAAEYFGVPAGVAQEDILRYYKQHAEEESYDTMRPYPGAEGFLRAVVAHGGHNYLYTHRGPSSVEALGFYGLKDLFTGFVTSADGFAPKPSPDALNHLCERYRLNKESSVMLGDRSIDLDAGKNAGMACALFDPDGLCPSYDTPFKARSYEELTKIMLDAE